MKSKLITFIVIGFPLLGFAQSKCDCKAFVDFNYNGQVHIYDKPAGVIVDSIRNDYAREDFLVMKILDTNGDYFLAELKRSIIDLTKYGWIIKKDYIGTYARNYVDGEILVLYSKPDKKSPSQDLITSWISDIYVADDCKNDWLHVKLKHEDKEYSGWLAPDMQCADPYSTCN